MQRIRDYSLGNTVVELWGCGPICDCHGVSSLARVALVGGRLSGDTMFHPRTSRKKLEQVIRTLDAAARIGHERDSNGFLVARIGERRWTDRYDVVIGKLEQGLRTKKFDLTRDEARLMVTALDLYNVRRTDGVGQSWNEEAEQLFQELQTLFAKTYGEGLYAA
jgi:hypothetical protein